MYDDVPSSPFSFCGRYFEKRFMDPSNPSLDSKLGAYPGTKFRRQQPQERGPGGSGGGREAAERLGWVPDGQLTTVLFAQVTKGTREPAVA